MARPRVLILRAPGTNCDGEARFAFGLAGADAEILHVNRLRENPNLLLNYQILVVPGGFTVIPNRSQRDVAGIGDASGRVLGLMPHPERHCLPTQSPHWTRTGLDPEKTALKLFQNAVGYFG